MENYPESALSRHSLSRPAGDPPPSIGKRNCSGDECPVYNATAHQYDTTDQQQPGSNDRVVGTLQHGIANPTLDKVVKQVVQPNTFWQPAETPILYSGFVHCLERGIPQRKHHYEVWVDQTTAGWREG